MRAFAWPFIVAACALLACTSALNCTWDSSLGTLEFTAYACPGNASCVVSAAAGARTVQQMFIPVGCCPSELPTPCLTNTSTYIKLHGCCPDGSVCCHNSLPGNNFLMGCADTIAQCCHDRICPPGYSCCYSDRGIACCPEGTLCRGRDFFVPIDAGGAGSLSTRALVSTFFDIPDDQLCIPAHMTSNENLTVAMDGSPTRYPLQLETYLNPGVLGGTLYYVTNVSETPDVFACGRGMCHVNDTCVNRYRNVSHPRVMRSRAPGCSTAKMRERVAWDAGCYSLGYEVEETAFEAGCCPADTTPCGAHSHTFVPQAINSHASPFLYYPVFACALANETCCYPYLCPATAQCCTARRQVHGIDINETALAETFGTTMLATANEGHNYCCPGDAFCCEFIPRVASGTDASRRPKTIPFCGTDETCTRDYYAGNRRLFHPDVVREAIQFTPGGNHYTDGLAFRTGLGIVGNTAYYGPNATTLDQTCSYQIDLNGDTNDVRYFDISCSVLNSGVSSTPSPAGVDFATNAAPFDQIANELLLSGPSLCPSPVPEPWCIMP